MDTEGEEIGVWVLSIQNFTTQGGQKAFSQNEDPCAAVYQVKIQMHTWYLITAPVVIMHLAVEVNQSLEYKRQSGYIIAAVPFFSQTLNSE